MRFDIGGFHERTDWPKMGPSLLITTYLILDRRTAKWPGEERSALEQSRAGRGNRICHHDRQARDGAPDVVVRDDLSPTKKSWYQPSDEDVPT